MGDNGKLVQRHQRVSFLNTGNAQSPVYTRMKGFTSLSNQKNPKEYTRQYVDEATERSDIVGVSPAKEFSFDRYDDDPVQEVIANIIDNELLGSDAHVDIVTVDLFDPTTSGGTTYAARKRKYAVISDTDSDGTDALIYSGSFKAVGEYTVGTATLSEDEQTATFTAAT